MFDQKRVSLKAGSDENWRFRPPALRAIASVLWLHENFLLLQIKLYYHAKNWNYKITNYFECIRGQFSPRIPAFLARPYNL